MTPWQQVAGSQDGVLARWQALAGGMTAEGWEWKLRSGRWQLGVPGIAVTHSGDPTFEQRAWAACLHAGEGAALSGDAALRLRGLRGDLGSGLDVVIPTRRRVRDRPVLGITPMRVRRADVPARRQVRVKGLPVLDAHLSVLHAASWAPTARAAEWRVAAAVQQRLTAPGPLRDALLELPRLPRRALLRAVLDDVELGAHAGSELAFLRFCRKHGLPLPDALQVRVRAGGTRYLDARYTRRRLSVELDGAHHRDAGRWEADALRSLQLAVAMPGERQVRLTMGNLRHDGEEVARLLAHLLA